MALPAPNLDDRTFQDIVDEAKRLIPQYCPEWTNHNVSDPGVALIELFAWMSEMVLFRLNQVPERLYVHFLNLVGIEPFPPSVARADLTFYLTGALDRPVVVPAGSEVGTAGAVDADAVMFTTVADLTIAPAVLSYALTAPGGSEETVLDVWADLRYDGAAVVCFPSSPVVPGDAFYLGFEGTLAGSLLRLQIRASIEGVGINPADPPLVWEVWSGEAWIQAVVSEDSTGGLNRDGNILLLIPLEHASLTLGPTRAYWLRARLVAAVVGQPTYQQSPKISSLRVDVLGGTIPGEHAAVQAGETVGRSEGRPDQSYKLSRSPILPRSGTEVVRVIDIDGAAEWQEVADFTSSGPHDRHVVWDSALGTVSFGPRIRYPDGTSRQHGAIPRDGAQVTVTGYRYGGGVVGNVGTGTLSTLRTTVPFIDRVSNLRPARGGVDAETVDNAKIRGPLTLRTGQRAVTPGDFERLTLESSTEVARARCLPAAVPGGPIRVLVTPHVRSTSDAPHLDDFALSDGLLATVRNHLDARRLVGSSIEVGTPYYQGISVAALLRSLPGRPAALVRQRAIDLLNRYLNPLTGGTEGEGWPYDTDINTATLAQMLEAVEGVERVEEVLLFEFDLRSGERLGNGRDILRLDRHSLFLSARHQVVVR